MLLNGTNKFPVSQFTYEDITLTCDDVQEENHGYVVVDFTVYDENGNEFVDDDFLEDDRNRNRELQPITAPLMKFADVKEAKTWAKSNVVGEYVNENTAEKINVSNASIDKFLSGKAIQKTGDFDKHVAILPVIPALVKRAVLGKTEADKNGNTNIKDIQRFYAVVGDQAVKLTVKRYADENMPNKAYSYEVKDIEAVDGIIWGNADKQNSTLPSTASLESLVQLFEERNGEEWIHKRQKDVENKKLL